MFKCCCSNTVLDIAKDKEKNEKDEQRCRWDISVPFNF